MRSTAKLAGALLGLLIGINGCGDAAPIGITAPGRTAYEGLDPDPQRPVRVGVLTRTTELASDISVTASIGKAGGTISIPQAGFSITFAPNAVKKTVSVTATALKGNEVAYEFQPHGITFYAPVSIRQALAGTDAYQLADLSTLEGAYFASRGDLYTTTQEASVTEFQPTTVDAAGSSVSFNVPHFSGYLVATGRQQ